MGVQLDIVGPSANPRPPALPSVDGLRMALSGPSRQSSTTIVGGRQRSEVRVTYQIEIVPSRTGHFVVPPFPIWTGTREQTVRQLELDHRKRTDSDHLGQTIVRPVLPSRRPDQLERASQPAQPLPGGKRNAMRGAVDQLPADRLGRGRGVESEQADHAVDVDGKYRQRVHGLIVRIGLAGG